MARKSRKDLQRTEGMTKDEAKEVWRGRKSSKPKKRRHGRNK